MSRLDYWRQRSARMRAELLALLGGKCARCGFSDARALQIDHVRGGGGNEIRALGKSRLHDRIRRHTADYQVLCANCNWIKRAELGEQRGYGSHDAAPICAPLFDSEGGAAA